MRMPSPLAARMASVRAFVLVLCRPSDESQSGLLPYALYSDVMWRHCSSSILAGRAPASFLFITASISVAGTPSTEVSFSGAQVRGFSVLPARAVSPALHPARRAAATRRDSVLNRGCLRGAAEIGATIGARVSGNDECAITTD